MKADVIELIAVAYEKYKTIRATAKALGMSSTTVWRGVRLSQGKPTDYHSVKRVKEQDLGIPEDPGHGVRDRSNGKIRTIDSRSIKTLYGLLEAAEVDESWVCTRHKVNSWQALGKDGETHQLHQVTAHLERANDFWVAPITVENHIKRKPRKSEPAERVALIVPDTQHGFRSVENLRVPGLREWKPLHDRQAIDCVLRAAEKLGPDRLTHVVLLGDHLDLSPWSTRWATTPDSLQTTNAAMRELYAGLLRPLRELAPYAEIVMMMGNHEARIEDFLHARAPEASTLRPADTLDAKPSLDLETLLALDSLDIKLIAPYGRPYWLFDEIKIIHGNKARNRGGMTAAEYLKTATSSIIYGHIHRLEMAQARIQVPSGSRLVTAASPGCLASCEMGVVPARAGTAPDWQSGFGVVYQVDDSHSIQMIPIVDGVAVLEGQIIRGIDDLEAIREATGIPF